MKEVKDSGGRGGGGERRWWGTGLDTGCADEVPQCIHDFSPLPASLRTSGFDSGGTGAGLMGLSSLPSLDHPPGLHARMSLPSLTPPTLQPQQKSGDYWKKDTHKKGNFMIHIWLPQPQGTLGEGYRLKDCVLGILCLLRLQERMGTSQASWQKKGDNFFLFKDIPVHLVEIAVGDIRN